MHQVHSSARQCNIKEKKITMRGIEKGVNVRLKHNGNNL